MHCLDSESKTDSAAGKLSPWLAMTCAMLLGDRCQRWGRVLSVLLLVCIGVLGGNCPAQPPGTYPPAETLRPPLTPEQPGRIPIKGILFLDASKNPVLMPRMTYERLLELESGSKSQASQYVFEGVRIEGRVEGNRAELNVELQVRLEATGDETVKIPLAMENFHRLGPAEFFAGSSEGNKLAVSVDPGSGGHELLASVKEDTVVGVRMQMSARVETESTNALDFRLPPSPVIINLTSDSSDVVGQIANRDDEVIETGTDSLGRSQFKVESSGGQFTLQWGQIERPVSVPLMEATSVIALQWNSPQDPLIQNVRMTVRDSRGPISNFMLRLPEGAALVDKPKMITSGQFGQTVELASPDSGDKSLFQVTVPKAERRTSVILEFQIEIPSDSPTASSPLAFQVPIIEEAIRNQGTVNITTGADYRLRWRQRPYVKNVTSTATEESTAQQRAYSFEFIRGAFKLPLWLDATKRELRVTSVSEIEVREQNAILTMVIESTGDGSRAQLLSVDLADWMPSRIENGRTGAPLARYESEESPNQIDIETDFTGMEESSIVLIQASLPLSDPQDDLTDGSQEAADGIRRDNRDVNMIVPRVVGSGDRRDPMIIQEALVQVTGRGRKSLVIDMERSQHLERMVAEESDSNEFTREFSVLPPESVARIVGELVLQPPRLILEDTSTVQLVGDQLETVVNWKVESLIDLEGRLPVALGYETPADPADEIPWTVTVNDRPAQLRRFEQTDDIGDEGSASSGSASDSSDEGLRYELISDSLTDGAMTIRFRSVREIAIQDNSSQTDLDLFLPYPLVQDITLRGKLAVTLIGDEVHDLTPVEMAITDELTFRSLPKKPIPLRVSPRTRSRSELQVGKVVVRTAVNEVSQHDQLIASLVGAGEFELQLAKPDKTDVQVSLNGQPAAFKTVDDRLVVRVPSDSEQHLIDVRLWMDRTGGDFIQTIEPLGHLGPDSDQMFWQLTVPPDCHLVWATPSVGRLMQWGIDGGRLVRKPLLSETALIGRAAAIRMDMNALSPMPAGNRYLFSAMDDRAFRIMTGSRTWLWLVVASVIVLVTAVLTYVPATRSPFTFILGILAFAGLLTVAPDAAILVGQVAMLAMVLVVVMLAIRSLVLPSPSRVLSSTRESRADSSSQSIRPTTDYRPPSSVAVTHSIGAEDLTSAPDEVAS